MGKKSSRCLRFLENLSENSKIGYIQVIKHYEKFHGKSIEELVCEALDEQSERVPSHMLSIIDRIEDFQEHLIGKGLVYGTIQTYMTRIKSIYIKNRIDIPYIEPVNPKRCKRREYIEYKDILSPEEIKKAIQYMRPPAQARTLVIAQGGLSNEECEHLSLRSFIDELYKYHQCDDDREALQWLSNENHSVIWVTKLIRQKTKKPYYAVIGAEAVNKLAEAKLYSMGMMWDKKNPDKLISMNKKAYGSTCRKVNKKCGFGLIAEESKFRSHNLRRFHATRIKGSVLTYEENSRISNSEIDEMQGRGKTAVQDTYIKTNPLEQKLLYAKVMNNVSLWHEYDYELIDGDVIVWVKDHSSENKKLKKEVEILTKQLHEKKKASEKVEKLREELGDDVLKEMIGEILNAS